MDFNSANLCRNLCSKTGNGTAFLLGAAVTGCQSIAAMGDGAVDVFVCRKMNANQWEVFVGVYTSSNNRVTRTQFLSSSTGSPIVFATGEKEIFNALTAERKIVGDGLHIEFNDNATTGNRVATSFDLTHQQVIGRIGF